jgi:ABC-type branched-subunit amino acid transport system ATPase component
MTEDPILRTRALRREYGRGDGRVRAVDGIDLDIAQGETVAVMGPSQRCCICWAGSTVPPEVSCGSMASGSSSWASAPSPSCGAGRWDSSSRLST